MVNCVVLDLRENDLFLDTQGVIATTIKGPGRDTAEIADAGNCHTNEAIKKLVHPLTAQGDLATDGEAFTQLESRDCLFRFSDQGLLARNLSHVRSSSIDDLAVGNSLAHAHVYRDLGDPRNLHRVGQLKILAELGDNRLAVVFL